MLNPPLLLVSALFFLALASVLYVGAWLVATALLRVLAGRISHAGAKRVLIAALVLPPLLAFVPTLSGATLRHIHHAAAAASPQHHSGFCQQMFSRAFEVGGLAGYGVAGPVVGAVANAAAWVLIAVGTFLTLRLLLATVRLERGLAPYQSAPSPRLAKALARVGKRLPGLPARRFFECPIPSAYSSALGFWKPRCVLSRDLVAQASDEELDAIVAHEASHLRGGDVQTTFLVGMVNCLFFYLRPVRLLGRRWREEAELACDDQAVQVTRQPLAMASAILRASGVPVATTNGVGRRLPAVALAFADEAACSPGKRVERLLAQAQHASLPAAAGEPRRAVVAGWFLTAGLTAFGASLLRSDQAACFAHCSLEAIARLLHQIH
jgi:Zn-dependent protease with chaperone function